MHARGVGPAPIPVEEFSLQKLVDAIRFMLDPKVLLLPSGHNFDLNNGVPEPYNIFLVIQRGVVTGNRLNQNPLSFYFGFVGPTLFYL